MMKKTAMMVLVLLVLTGIMKGDVLSAPAATEPESDLSSVDVEKIAVMPFYTGKYGGVITQNVSCNVCQLVYDPKGLDPNADYFLTNYCEEALKKRFGQKVVPLRESTEAYNQIPKDELKDTIQSRAQNLGRELHANLIVTGNVWRYRDRVGGSRGVESPASVAFAIYLVEVDSGKLLWKSAFSETQKPLSENVLDARSFFKQGAKWLTASELAQYGVNEVFEKFPLK